MTSCDVRRHLLTVISAVRLGSLMYGTPAAAFHVAQHALGRDFSKPWHRRGAKVVYPAPLLSARGDPTFSIAPLGVG